MRDELHSTAVLTRLHVAGDAAAAAVLSWEDICCAVRVGGAGQLRQILTDVSGIAGAPGSALDSQSRNGELAKHATNGSISADSQSSPSRPAGRSSGGRSNGSIGGGMCAILGPSGAGKTTLLDILAGRRYGAGAISCRAAGIQGCCVCWSLDAASLAAVER